MAKTKTVEARVLVRVDQLDVGPGAVIAGAPGQIKALADAGLVDSAEAAVAYAKSLGAESIDVTEKAGAFAAELAALDEQNGVEASADDSATGQGA